MTDTIEFLGQKLQPYYLPTSMGGKGNVLYYTSSLVQDDSVHTTRITMLPLTFASKPPEPTTQVRIRIQAHEEVTLSFKEAIELLNRTPVFAKDPFMGSQGVNYLCLTHRGEIVDEICRWGHFNHHGIMIKPVTPLPLYQVYEGEITVGGHASFMFKGSKQEAEEKIRNYLQNLANLASHVQFVVGSLG